MPVNKLLVEQKFVVIPCLILHCLNELAEFFTKLDIANDLALCIGDRPEDSLRETGPGQFVMIGGNVKSVMSKDVRLSMPSVIDGHDYELRICGSHTRDVSAFQFFGGTFWVTVLDERRSRPN